MNLRRDSREPDPAAEDVGVDGSTSGRRRGWFSRGRILALLMLLLVVAAVALAVLSRPLLSAKREADRAQVDLKAAKTALSEKHLGQARSYIADARAHVDTADRNAHGFGADVWSVIPVADGAVSDARHLVDALSETTTVAELGVQVYPMVSGDSAHLVNGQSIDLKVLATVVAKTSAIGDHLDQALADVDQVKGDTPIVGGAVSRARDTALGYLQPVHDTYAQVGPLIRSLPSIVGANGPKTYLLAMLNPAELRYSGGGALSFTTMRFDHGVATFGTTVNVDDILAQGQFQRWKPVPGNIFHRPGPLRVTSATFSPWWSVSGEELLRGYEQVYPTQHLDGVIGLDLQSLADVFRVTGPVDLPHFGTINADNLVQTLAGSYGDFQSVTVRHQLNAELVPAFRQKFFEAGHTSDKVRALVDSAKGRHFFAYFRNANVERRFGRVGLDGDLSPTVNDYLGVFTQNINGSKVDYWQHRALTSDVHLHADGSAQVHLSVTVSNQAPPYALAVPDPKIGYTTRYLQTVVGVFLPKHAQIEGRTLDGSPYLAKPHTPHVKRVRDRRFVVAPMLLNAGEQSTFTLTYTVPAAAVKDADGLTYRLDIDPQDLVNPETVHVNLTWPKGWHAAASLPTGWREVGSGRAVLDATAAQGLAYELQATQG